MIANLANLVENNTADRSGRERGGALVELAIAIPIFLGLIALIFDIGIGFSAARDSSTAARSAARVAALAGDDRLADYRALDAVRSEYAGSSDEVEWISIYLSPPGSGGQVPAGCGEGAAGNPDQCNTYPGSILDSLSPANFADPDCVGDPDENWCPVGRAADDGNYLGVAVWTSHPPTTGLFISEDYKLDDRAVFAMYFADP